MKMRTPFENIYGRVGLVIYTKPSNCGGRCLYCFSQKGFPPSFLKNEDTLRAKECEWDPARQIEKLFNLYNLDRGYGNKCDMIVLGGSFTKYSRDYLLKYVKAIYDFLNGTISTRLEETKKLQENAPDRCVTFSIETRPNLIDEDWCDFLLTLGVTKVEIGVQSLEDSVLEVNQRDYTAQTVICATRLLRNYGFKIGYHMMVGMVGSTWELDVETLSNRLWQKDFCPDYLKIYPCVFLKGNFGQNGLAMQLASGWKPLTDETYNQLLMEIKPKIPPYVKINRVQRIISPNVIAWGPSGVIDRKRFSAICKCIWHRSVGRRGIDLNGDLRNYRIKNYKQGDGFYVEAVFGKDTILGYARVSFNRREGKAMMRELRVFGKMLRVGERNAAFKGVQHIGIGKALTRRVEGLALQNKCVNLLVNAGVGVRRYFEAIGYKEEGNYLIKKLTLKDNIALAQNNLS